MADWPLSSDLGPLGALPTAPRLARGFVSVVLSGWRLEPLLDVTQLLVSELATNVVQASMDTGGNLVYGEDGKLPVLWVRLMSDRARLVIEVWDTLPEMLGAPAVRHPHWDDESGRGLEMLETLAEDWGWESVPGWHGKRVWAILKVTPLTSESRCRPRTGPMEFWPRRTHDHVGPTGTAGFVRNADPGHWAGPVEAGNRC